MRSGNPVGEYGGLDINKRIEIEVWFDDVGGNSIVIGTIGIEDKQEGVKYLTKFLQSTPLEHN